MYMCTVVYKKDKNRVRLLQLTPDNLNPRQLETRANSTKVYLPRISFLQFHPR